MDEPMNEMKHGMKHEMKHEPNHDKNHAMKHEINYEMKHEMIGPFLSCLVLEDYFRTTSEICIHGAADIHFWQSA